MAPRTQHEPEQLGDDNGPLHARPINEDALLVVPDSAGKGGKRPRGLRRRLILREAARLFSERGYHATGIDDIGDAAGITGPAVYRHFSSKQDILLALIDESADTTEGENERIRQLGGSPREMLENLVRMHVHLAHEYAHVIIVARQERVNLPDEERSRVIRRDRKNREEWVDLLSRARPVLSEPDVRVRAVGARALMIGLATEDLGFDRQRMEAIAFDMIMAALGV